MEPFAIIDLGTNTFNLLIFSKKNTKEFEVIYKTQIPVKLGENGINTKIIQKPAFERGINALIEYRRLLDVYKVVKYRAIGTSALRNANNTALFIQEVFKKTKIHIEIISGEEEAMLIFKGVKLAMTLPTENSIIMDIGGGSVEFILIKNGEKIWVKSFNIGAARLLEIYNNIDPIPDNCIVELFAFLELQLKELVEDCLKFNVHTLIGSSGSFDSFMEMMELEFKNRQLNFDKSFYEFDFKNLKKLLEKIIKTTKIERENYPGLISFRADMIVISALLTKYIIHKLHINKMYLSTYALKEGLIFEM